jgi:hypothetical protein
MRAKIEHSNGDDRKSRDANEAVDGPYTLQQFELNCASHQIRTASFANHAKTGQIASTRRGGNWENIFPDSLGETIQNSVCAAN